MQRAAWAAGVTEGTRGALRPRPGGRRSRVLGARKAAQAGMLLLPPSPHLSGHPPRSPCAQAAPGSIAEPARACRARSLLPLSRRDVAVAVGACARDPKGGGLSRPVSMATSVRLSTGAVRGGAYPAPSCCPQTTGLPRVTEQEPLGIWVCERTTARPQALGEVRLVSRRGEPGWDPGSRHQKGMFEEVWEVRHSNISLWHLYRPWSCHFLSLRLRDIPENQARQGHLLPFYS